MKSQDMHLFSLVALHVFFFAALTSAGDNPGIIDPTGKITHDEEIDSSLITDKTPEYMFCNAKKDVKCGNKSINRWTCLVACEATKRKDTFAEISCDAYKSTIDENFSCDKATIDATCQCDVGYWIQDKFPHLHPPSPATAPIKPAKPAK